VEADKGTVLDVRQAGEVAGGHLPGAVPMELGDLAGDPMATRGLEGPVTVMCSHGQRAMTATSLLERAGHTDLQVARGGPQDWHRATGRALIRP
jgi:rhodanese-related sulfurtransferase